MNSARAEGAPLEIERVFLLRGFPSLPAPCQELELEQGYLPERDGIEGRLRRQAYPDGRVVYLFTHKEGEGMVRREREHELSEQEFAARWPETEGRRLKKTRSRVVVGGLTWEIDRFEDLDLVMAEVELPTPETPAPLPEWLIPQLVREVTEDARYRNYRLATEGLPTESA